MLLFEDTSCTGDLLPFTAVRPVLDLRMGILTFREKWERLLGAGTFSVGPLSSGPALPANLLPTQTLAALIREEMVRGPLTQGSIDRLIAMAGSSVIPGICSSTMKKHCWKILTW